MIDMAVSVGYLAAMTRITRRVHAAHHTLVSLIDGE